MIDRAAAVAADATDPLAHFRDEFFVENEELIYLDGNSLGRMPRAAGAAIDAVAQEWRNDLVLAWERWIDLPTQIGDSLAPLLGAQPGEVLLGDQTSVNLFKLATAAVSAERPDIVTDDQNFPSDIYVLDGVASAAGGTLRVIEVDPIAGVSADDVAASVDDRVGLVSHSLVGFRSGALADMVALTQVAHDGGALVLWDVAHAVGAVPVAMGASKADFAVGCTYKYLNGGPGAPAFVVVRHNLHARFSQPIQGWWSHADMFGFSHDYVPAADIRRFAVGTPPVLSLAAAGVGIALAAEAGIDAIRHKSTALTELLIERADTVLGPHGFVVATPRDPARRGSHVALEHPEAFRLSQALRSHDVIPDYRAPDTIRLGVASLYTRYVDAYDAIDRLGDIVATKDYERFPAARLGVT